MIAELYPTDIYGRPSAFPFRVCQTGHHHPFDQEFPLGQKTPTVLNQGRF